jgi:hypothetical protein
MRNHCRTAALTSIIVGILLVAPLIGQYVPDYRWPTLTHEEGWTELFNGKDLSGWIVYLGMEDKSTKSYLPEDQTVFAAENGLITATGDPQGCLRTLDIFDNFVFHVEIRFPEGKGNTGVLIYCQDDEVWPQAVECQGYNDHMGRIFPIRGAELEGGEMIHFATNPPGEWNTYEVYSEEGRIATVVNGKVVGLASEADPSTGYICLQSEGVPVEFRNIKIKRFTPAHRMRPKPKD